MNNGSQETETREETELIRASATMLGLPRNTMQWSLNFGAGGFAFGSRLTEG